MSTGGDSAGQPFPAPTAPPPAAGVNARDASIWALGPYDFHPDSGIAVLANDPGYSLSDPEIILMRPLTPPRAKRERNGSPLYGENDIQFLIDIANRRREIQHALQVGKTLFIEVGDPIGSRAFRLVRDYSSNAEVIWGHDVLPAAEIPAWSPVVGHRMRVDPAAPVPLRTAAAELASLSMYVIVFDEAIGWSPLLLTRTDSRRTSVYSRVGDGHVVLLPHLSMFHASDGEAPGAVESVRFAKVLRDIDRWLRRSEGSAEVAPDWAESDRYVPPALASLETRLQAAKERQAELAREIADIGDSAREAELTRSLLTAQGRTLEDAVRRGLRFFGIETDSFRDDSLGVDVDVFGEVAGVRLMGEVEGKDNRAIDNEKASQLATNWSAYLSSLSDEDVSTVKPLLFGNPQRLTAPELRDKTFTARCLQLVPRNTALILTSGMFEPIAYLEMNPQDSDYARLCRDAILFTQGLVVFPTAPA